MQVKDIVSDFKEFATSKFRNTALRKRMQHAAKADCSAMLVQRRSTREGEQEEKAGRVFWRHGESTCKSTVV